MSTSPTWLPVLAYSEADLRAVDSMLLAATGTAFGSRPGLRPGDPGLTVTLSGSTINVSTGVAALFRPGQGVYRAYLPAVSPGTLTAADPTYTRIDLVYLRVWDTSVDGTGLRKADAVYLPGTPSATPAAPSPGATEIAIPLATITIPAAGGGSPSVSTAVRPYTVAPGGVLPAIAAADLALAGTYTGQTRYNGTRATLETWNGSSWVAAGDWASYTPVWAGASVAPAIGNGTLTGRYTLIGKTVHVLIKIVGGSTTTWGTGAWSWTLPPGLPFATNYTTGLGATVGTAYADRSPGAGNGPSQVWVQDSTRVRAFTSSIGPSSSWSDSIPWVPVSSSSNTYSLAFTYETP